MEAAERDEKTAQKEYEDLMGESSTTRAQNAKSITDKEASGAQLESKLAEAEESKAMSTETLEDVGMTINHLHTRRSETSLPPRAPRRAGLDNVLSRLADERIALQRE